MVQNILTLNSLFERGVFRIANIKDRRYRLTRITIPAIAMIRFEFFIDKKSFRLML
jgi:hypothetical protein